MERQRLEAASGGGLQGRSCGTADTVRRSSQRADTERSLGLVAQGSLGPTDMGRLSGVRQGAVGCTANAKWAGRGRGQGTCPDAGFCRSFALFLKWVLSVPL